MESYKEYYAKVEDYESKEYERRLKENEEFKKTLKEQLQRIEFLACKYIDTDLEDYLADTQNEIDILQSMF